ncbi:MAG: tetratricopeptide repeat protein, partial [Planctomycetaceae bacterium]|nr:tetratricopeptide repeat protein [Planctomycetaceae bacterium]
MDLLAQIVELPPDVQFLAPRPAFDLWRTISAWGATLYLPFMIWMLVSCLRNDPERGVWLWIILIFHPVGAVIYFLARWLPGAHIEAPSFIKRFSGGRNIHRLEIAARQIGNPHQFIEWGDALGEAGRWDKALDAYLQALAKDASNPQALWGAGCCQFRAGEFGAAYESLKRLLDIDPAYKFGDVSLMYGKTLHALRRSDEARAHLESHIRRWRHPEALYL